MTSDSCFSWEPVWIVPAELYSFLPSSVCLACRVVNLGGTLVCWAPFTTYSLIATFNSHFYYKHNFFEISTWLLWLCYLKSALNPLIYYWRIKKFHDACLDLMPKYFKFLPQLPGHTRRRIRPSAIYVCGEHRHLLVSLKSQTTFVINVYLSTCLESRKAKVFLDGSDTLFFNQLNAYLM
ncbi:probable G-protein coupled receptor 63 isoform X4 [Falco naumanni]|uniref:probable G-protein coupled receptor 63 isoform X4 n=1 Tax=Falco naumanni TaxID=148594 RepID=UPI001ADE4ABE|nr:probable G-protein coupled receptor 63 isoform X4 [Falco naumanni]